jgi:hypothetical protein
MKYRNMLSVGYLLLVAVCLVFNIVNGGPELVKYGVEMFMTGRIDVASLVSIGFVNTVILLILVLYNILFPKH